MSANEIGGIARTVLAAAGGILVTKGYIDSGTLTAVIGAIVTLGTAAWSVYAKRRVA